MSEWEITTIGAICDLTDGTVQTGPFGSDLHASDYSVIGTPVIMPANLRKNQIIEDGIARIGEEHVIRLKNHQLVKDDIVFPRRGDVARYAVIDERYEGWLCGTGCLRIRFEKNSIIDPKYLGYWLGTARVEEWLLSNAVGTTMPNLNTSILKALPVPLPPLEEQHSIADILGSLDDKIEANRRMNETLEAIARAIFKSWFVDFDPVHYKARGEHPPGMDAETAALFPDSFEESALGPCPAGWRVGTLGGFLSVLETGDRPKGGVSDYSDGIPSIGAESVVSLGVFDYTKTKYVPEEYYANLRRGKIENRDVLLYKDGGRPGIFIPHVSMFGDGFPFDTMCINSHVYRLRSTILSQEYLFFWVSSPLVMDEMHLVGGGAAIPGINSEQVRQLPALVPPVGLIEAFSAITEPIISAVFSNCNESRTLAETRDALLPKLVSGELRVGELA